MRPWPHGHIVPDGWAARHRPVVAGFFCDTVRVIRKTGTTPTGPFGADVDQWTDITPPDGVPALVQVVHTAADGVVDSAGHPLIVAEYLCRLDVDWLPDSGDRIIVTASPDPANLGTYTVSRRESQGHVVDRTVHLERVSADTD